MNIVKTEFSREATIFESERGGRIRRWTRHVLRQLRLIPPRRALNLFQAHMGAYRFETDDGRVAIVPVAMELVNDSAVDAEELARSRAVKELGERMGWGPTP